MLYLPTQHKLGVLQGLVVEQPVQFRPLRRGVAVLVLNGNTVDSKDSAIRKVGFHPVGVHVEAAGKQFVHSEPHFYINGVCSDVLNPAIKPMIDLSIGLCFARLHIFAHFLHT